MKRIAGRTGWASRLAVSLLLIVCLSACASARQSDSGPAININVRNDLTPSLNVSISALADGGGGGAVRLGTLVAGASESYTYRPTIVTSTFRLIADRPGPGASLVSEPIPFPRDGALEVEWHLSTNNVIIR